jgi:uncharacterized protein
VIAVAPRRVDLRPLGARALALGVALCVLALSGAREAAADPGYVGFGAGGPTFRDHATIVMESQDLVFRLAPDGDAWDAQATYVLWNAGAEPAAIPVGFPYELGTDYVAEHELDLDDDDASLALEPFEMRVDGALVATADDGAMRIAEVAWEAGQRRRIEYRYRHRPDDRFDYHALRYWQRSGATWAGPIGRAAIAVELPPGLVAVTSSLPARVDEQGWLRVERLDWEPDRDLHLDLIDAPLADWLAEFRVCDAALLANPASQLRIAETLASLNVAPAGGECAAVSWSSEHRAGPSTYFCLLAADLELPAESAECAARLRAAAGAEEPAQTEHAPAVEPDPQAGKDLAADELESLRSPSEAQQVALYEVYLGSCSRGEANACARLTKLYVRGERDNRSPERAQQALVSGCGAGNANACYIAGFTLIEGSLGEVDEAGGMPLLDTGCTLEHGHCCAMLGLMHEFGRGTPENPAAAFPYFERACELGEANVGCFNVALHLTQVPDDELDLPRILDLFDRSCRAGTVQACENREIVETW